MNLPFLHLLLGWLVVAVGAKQGHPECHLSTRLSPSLDSQFPAAGSNSAGLIVGARLRVKGKND